MSVDDNVREFNEACELHIAAEPCVPTEGRMRQRGCRIVEECFELLESLGFDNIALTRLRLATEAVVTNHHIDWLVVDLPSIAKEAADLDYVVAGLRVECGIPGDEIAAEVHASNMSKCVDGRVQRRSDGKVLKGPNYRPADVESILRAHGYRS